MRTRVCFGGREEAAIASVNVTDQALESSLPFEDLAELRHLRALSHLADSTNGKARESRDALCSSSVRDVC